MGSINYITIRVGLKNIVLFQDDFINNDPDKTMKYLYMILTLLYDEQMIDISFHSHDFIEEV
jgi:hypothetical protein